LLLEREPFDTRKITTCFLRENRLLYARDHLHLKKEPLATGKPTCFWRENHLLPERDLLASGERTTCYQKEQHLLLEKNHLLVEREPFAPGEKHLLLERASIASG
jgi:hypothetical protein